MLKVLIMLHLDVLLEDIQLGADLFGHFAVWKVRDYTSSASTHLFSVTAMAN